MSTRLAYPLRVVRPARPRRSFFRAGYEHTRWNPAGIHVGWDSVGDDSVGTIVQSITDGVINRIGRYGDLGLVVRVADPIGLEWWYCHLLRAGGFRFGDRVNAGGAIARSGGATGHPNSGRSSGPHLHVATLATPLGDRVWGSVPYLDPFPFVLAAWEKARAA